MSTDSDRRDVMPGCTEGKENESSRQEERMGGQIMRQLQQIKQG
jgi:hypothetical protein